MTMRTTKTMTVSLPPEMAEEFEAVRKAERRTRSELAREAFRTYFSRFKVVSASPAEEAAIQRGRREFSRGEFVTLTELRNELDAKHHKKRAKGARKTSG